MCCTAASPANLSQTELPSSFSALTRELPLQMRLRRGLGLGQARSQLAFRWDWPQPWSLCR